MSQAFSSLVRQLLRRTLVLNIISRQCARRIMPHSKLLFLFFCCTTVTQTNAQPKELDAYNVIWNTQSKNSSESMPCGGGDIGLNVWVEKGEVFLYLSQSGMFDENNALLKAGRVRLTLSPNPFAGQTFKQELVLKDGYINISGSNGTLSADINVWVDVFHPTIHLAVKSNQPVNATAAYESWRYRNRPSSTQENKANSWKWVNVPVITQKDVTDFKSNKILFYHRNMDSTVFDVTVKHEGLDSIKNRLFNPLKQLCFGGLMQGSGMQPAGTYEGKYLDTDFKGWKLASNNAGVLHNIDIVLHTNQVATTDKWQEELELITQRSLANTTAAWQTTKQWWQQFWNRSFVFINTGEQQFSNTSWQTGRNYQLFRYMLGCNAFGKYPTKFNGGLFTYDPVFTDSSLHGTPDHRNWGGGTFTAQNQRLVYWPMLKSGDIDLMQSQFNFYAQIQKNAELRTLSYWKHNGASFTEQMENFGLPNMAEYGLKRPADFDKGVEYNAWLEYEWDTALEFCMMILETEKYQGKNISAYIPLIESCLIFFDEHYQYLAKQRGNKKLDGDGKLVLFPGSGAETFKMAYNSTSTIAALETVTKELLRSKYLAEDRKKYFSDLLTKIPPISFRNFNGHVTIAPAKLWERVNNVESPQLYPVFPWGMYGIGKPGLDTAINTWLYDTLVQKFRSAVGWKQDNIFAARLGLTEDAARLTNLKLQNSERRFPTFWGPGFDWTPDMNQGGSGMIGLQEMLLQTDDKKILLFPAWKKDWNVHFKLHAPYNTTVEGILINGKLVKLEVLPKEREKDVVNMLSK
ncbi:MAG: DUF5703 domain-containing protein [Bacteroidota bacterium]